MPPAASLGVLFDIDGVLYVGDQPIPGAIEAMQLLRTISTGLRLVTNTTSKPRREIVERRAPWRPDFGPEWSTVGVARLRYTATKHEWTLQSAGSNGRWSRYEHINPVSRISVLLDEIDRDPTGIFWG